MKNIGQIRLSNEYNKRIIHKGQTYKLNPIECCGVREWEDNELYHILVECNLYKEKREEFISTSSDLNEIKSAWINLLNDPTIESMKAASLFIINVLKM